MVTKGVNVRNIVLMVLFVMILICSLLSVSYSYYTSSAANDNNFFLGNTAVECLSISFYNNTGVGGNEIFMSLPSYFVPTGNTNAITTSATAGVLSGETGRSFGMVGVGVRNNCNKEVKFDVVFIPQAGNTLSMNNIIFSECDNNITYCSAGSGYSNNFYSLGHGGCTKSIESQNCGCFNASSPLANGPWSWLAYKYNLGGDDQRICSFTRQLGSTAQSVSANSTKVMTFRYWLSPTYSGGSGKVLKGRIVIFTVYT